MTIQMSALDRLPTVSLDELNDVAQLLTRTDRKYVVPAGELDAVVTGLYPTGRAGLRVLEVDGRRSSRYESTYLDTVDLDSWTGAATRRRHRWKVRSRVYADTGERWLEVKTRGLRGTTVKERLPHDGPDVSGHADAWVRDRLGAARVHDVDPSGLVATLHTSYRRTTLLLPGGAGRATIDRDLRWVSGHGTAEVGDVLVVETKSGTPRPARWTGGCGSSATGRSGSRSTAPGWRCSPPTSPATAGTASPAATSPATSPSAKEPSHEPPRTPSLAVATVPTPLALLRRRDERAPSPPAASPLAATRRGTGVWDATQVHEVDVEVDEDAFAAMIDTYQETDEKEWLEATVTIDGETFERAGLRLKGNSSLRSVTDDADPTDLPWLIRLDKFVDGQ